MNSNEEKWLEISVMEIEQPIGKFYIGKALANDVTRICSADKRQKVINDELDAYIGIQRQLNEARKKEIEKFVLTEDASFPSSVVLAVKEGAYEYDNERKIIKIKEDRKSCNILDGQHRLSGFPANTENKFELILTIFPELDLEYQSYLFSVINTRSTRINPSLAQDLYAFSKVDTPERLAHRIARVFNKTEENPWFMRLKLLGMSDGNKNAILSQSTFTKYIVELISRKEDTYQIRDVLKRNNNKRKALKDFKSHGPLWDKYINGEDKYIYDLLKCYFIAAKQKFQDNWGDHNSIITKTTGYAALMNVLKYLLKRELPNEPDVGYFKKYFDNIPDPIIERLDSEHYTPGQVGESDLQKDILKGMGFEKGN
ncbi:MAG: DGQHR domain-containing protein [archaeon]